jgi:L-threonine-O-3-phosphate decarboxylase
MGSAVHGGPDLDELERFGLKADEVLDFSANINPFGPSPAVRAALAQARVDRYPDPEARVLRQALGEHLNVAPTQILAGNGASELIWLVALAFIRPSDRVLVFRPTYAEYARAAALMGASVMTVQATEEDRFAVNSDTVLRSLRKYQPRVAFLCNPNNPTGTTISPDDIAAWVARNPQTVFVVDEAYLPFAASMDPAINIQANNVLVLRSMTKDFGLAGLRLGYVLGAEEMIGWLARARPPWSVNSVAQAAGAAVLRDLAYYCDTLAALERAKADLIGGLRATGLEPMPSATPFFLVRVGDGPGFREVLLRRGILVRACASFGLPGHVRIATRRPEENARLLAAIRQLRWPQEASHAG